MGNVKLEGLLEECEALVGGDVVMPGNYIFLGGTNVLLGTVRA